MRLLLTVLACSFALQAQSWDALRGLRPGERIKVSDNSRETYSGDFQSVSERSISLAARKGVVEIERGRVRRVEVRASSRRVRIC